MPNVMPRSFIFTEIIQVHFEPYQKHQVEQTDIPENFEAAVISEEIQPVRAEQGPGQNHADNVGNTQFVQQQRGKQNYSQHDKKYQYRIGKR